MLLASERPKGSAKPVLQWACFWLMVLMISLLGVGIQLLRDAEMPPMPADPDYPQGELDTTIWWFGYDNAKDNTRDVNGNQYFDPSKTKSLIVCLGWAVNSVKVEHRESMNFALNDPKYGLDVDMAAAWLDDGWNVGIFYWNQLADEKLVTTAEDKIWSTDGHEGMRWLQNNLTYTNVDSPLNPDKSVGELLANEYSFWMANHSSTEDSEIRMVGHSLGNQVISAATGLIATDIVNGKLGKNAMPSRLMLADPYYSYQSKPFLDGGTTAPHVLELLSQLMAPSDALGDGLVVEFHKTSLATSWPSGDSNPALQAKCAYARQNPTYAHFWDFTSKHRSASNLYLLSYGDEQLPVAYGVDGKKVDEDCVSAKLSTNDVRGLMGNKLQWQQVEGLTTVTTTDDKYQRFHNTDEVLYAQMGLSALAIAIAYILIFNFETCYVYFKVRDPSTMLELYTYVFPVISHFATCLIGIVVIYIVGNINNATYSQQLILLLVMVCLFMRPLISIARISSKQHQVSYAAHLYSYLTRPSHDYTEDRHSNYWCCFSKLTVHKFLLVWYIIRRIIFIWLLLLPYALANSVPADASGDMSHEEIDFWGIDLSLLGGTIFFIGFVLDLTADHYKRKAFEEPPTVYSAPNTYTELYPEDAAREEGANNNSRRGVWRVCEIPHILGVLLCAWGLYALICDTLLGAATWNRQVCALISITIITCVTLFDHAPNGYTVTRRLESLQHGGDDRKHSCTGRLVESWTLTKTLIVSFIVFGSLLTWFLLILKSYRPQPQMNPEG